jgi:hypothetical protein
MPFDELMASRIRQRVGGDPSMSERKMFGGLCFMTNSNMCFGVVGDESYDSGWTRQLEAVPGYALCSGDGLHFTGRSMKGTVYVSSEGLCEDVTLNQWLEAGLDYASSLPPKD